MSLGGGAEEAEREAGQGVDAPTGGVLFGGRVSWRGGRVFCRGGSDVSGRSGDRWHSTVTGGGRSWGK